MIRCVIQVFLIFWSLLHVLPSCQATLTRSMLLIPTPACRVTSSVNEVTEVTSTASCVHLCLHSSACIGFNLVTTSSSSIDDVSGLMTCELVDYNGANEMDPNSTYFVSNVTAALYVTSKLPTITTDAGDTTATEEFSGQGTVPTEDSSGSGQTTEPTEEYSGSGQEPTTAFIDWNQTRTTDARVTTATQTPSLCASNPCLNNGTCIETLAPFESGNYACNCLPGYSLPDCSVCNCTLG